ncbi:helix-turn-helix domain-containing protein [Saliphagus sp. LR7]|uniref:helix-turn-helix domain-containing protein n=1 Tax=Saliphagus sp. LR7 TaxID=2282654 RepID=UPI000DF7D9EA|nr:helix-turn-helix domain-containing protein [Saliphagus sp. LR7]
MSYDTEHVRNAGTNPGRITSIPTFTELFSNAALASLYTSIRHSPLATAPELTETATVSKKTVYEYLRKLEQAGLITETGVEDGTSIYEAEDFELTLMVRDVEVSITPDLIEVVAHRDEYPVINRVLEDHGLVAFALVYDLVTAHSQGEITIRQIATLTELSSGTAYDIVEALYEIQDLGDDDSSPATYTPADFADERADLRDE